MKVIARICRIIVRKSGCNPVYPDDVNDMVYSYLMASIGSILAALRAGKYPNPTPMMVQTM